MDCGFGCSCNVNSIVSYIIYLLKLIREYNNCEDDDLVVEESITYCSFEAIHECIKEELIK